MRRPTSAEPAGGLRRRRDAPGDGEGAALFLYGTLLDVDVFARVAGHPQAAFAPRAAILEGWRRVHVEHAIYPTLVRKPREQVAGLLIGGVGDAVLARLAAYEGPHYDLFGVKVLPEGSTEPVAARVFVTRPGVPATPRRWDLETWSRRHKQRYLRGL